MEKNILIHWNDLYLIGYDVVDSQHKKLIDIINRFYDAFSKAQAHYILGDILREMNEYTQYHFQIEEELFEKYNYTEKDLHTKQHQYFINKTNAFLTGLEAQTITLSYDVMNFLKDWLLKHIQIEDRKYIPLLKENKLI